MRKQSIIKNNTILFIGPYSKTPKGGVAFVLSEYKKLFPDNYFVASTISKNKFTKVFGFIWGILHFIFLLITKPQIKIVHIHGASYNSFKRKYIIYKISKLFRKKVIYHIHGAEFKFFYKKSNNKTKNKIQNFINNTDCIICLSESWKIFFEKEFNPKQIEIIPNIIENSNHISLQWNDKPNILRFLLLGFIDKRKGVWLLLETLSKHKVELESKAVFYIGGNGETQKLQNLIKEYQLENIVKFIGWVSGEEKQKFLSNADIYLLPSYNEGLPISILEAMSYSKPILSTRVGGIPEIVDESNGILIDAGDNNQLWEAISSLISLEKNTLQKMGVESFKKVKCHLPEAVKKNLDNLYNSIL